MLPSLIFSSPPSPSPSPSPSSQCAREGARCDYSLFVGASNSNATSLPHLSSQALALKMYLNTTFSTLKLDSMETWMKVRLTLRMWQLLLHLCSFLPPAIYIESFSLTAF